MRPGHFTGAAVGILLSGVGGGLMLLALLLSGCAALTVSDPIPPTRPAAVSTAGLRDGRLALLTPTATFGQEENRQSVARAFQVALADARPDLPLLGLPETLSAINAANLFETYAKLHQGYRESGLLERAPLKAVGETVGARYLVQLKVQSFQQNNAQRFAYLGVSLLKTQTTSLRLFLQVWDSQAGAIIWEDSAEVQRQVEAIRERGVGLEAAVTQAARDLIARLPE